LGIVVSRSRSTRFTFLSPCFRHCPRFLDLIDNQNEPMLVVAIKNLYVHPRLGHAARQFAQLPRFVLTQPLDHHIALFQNSDSRALSLTRAGRRELLARFDIQI